MSHLFITVGAVPDSVTEWVGKEIEKEASAWLTYFPGQWVICTSKPFETWLARLSERVLSHRGYLLIMELGHNQRASGVLPKEAWDWLRNHHFKVG